MKSTPVIAAIMVCSGCCYGSVRADLVLDWNNLSRGALTNPANGIVGSYTSVTTAPTNGVFTRFTVEERPQQLTFPVSVSISNQTYTGAGTNWIRNNTGAGTADEIVYVNFSPVNRAAVAGFIKCAIATNGFVNLDLIALMAAAGWASLNYTDFTTGWLRAHSSTNGGASTYGSGISFSTNKIYFYTMTRLQVVGDSWVKLRLYDPDGGYSLVKESDAGLTTATAPIGIAMIESGYLGDPAGSVWIGPMYIIFEPTDAEIAGMLPTQTNSTINTIGRTSFGESSL